MKYDIGTRVCFRLDGRYRRGTVVAAFDGKAFRGSRTYEGVVRESFRMLNESSYAVVEDGGDPWVCQEAILDFDDFLTRLEHEVTRKRAWTR